MAAQGWVIAVYDGTTTDSQFVVEVFTRDEAPKRYELRTTPPIGRKFPAPAGPLVTRSRPGVPNSRYRDASGPLDRYERRRHVAKESLMALGFPERRVGRLPVDLPVLALIIAALAHWIRARP